MAGAKKLRDLPYIVEGDAAGLFIATYAEAARVWRGRGDMIQGQTPHLSPPSGPDAAATREGRRAVEAYGQRLIELADALDAAMDPDRPGAVAMLDLSKLDPAAAAFGRMVDAYEKLLELRGVAAGADNVAGSPPFGHA